MPYEPSPYEPSPYEHRDSPESRDSRRGDVSRYYHPDHSRFDGNVWAVRIGFFLGIGTLLFIAFALAFLGPR